jgi:hypothetical protein
MRANRQSMNFARCGRSVWQLHAMRSQHSPETGSRVLVFSRTFLSIKLVFPLDTTFFDWLTQRNFLRLQQMIQTISESHTTALRTLYNCYILLSLYKRVNTSHQHLKYRIWVSDVSKWSLFHCFLRQLWSIDSSIVHRLFLDSGGFTA